MPLKEPWIEQEEDLIVAARQARCMNLSEPGTGKTGTAAILTYWHWFCNNKKTIWVQPNHLREKNRGELYAFTDFKPGEVEVLEKASETLGPRKRKGFPKADPETGFIDYIASSDAKVFVVGFTFLRMHYQHLLECHPEIDLVVVDEGHLGYKTNSSQASQALYRVMEHCSRFYYMTGSPIDGRLDSAFVPIHIINPGYYGSYAGFIRQHAGWIDDYGNVAYWTNEDKVREILRTHSVRRLWRDIHGDQLRDTRIELIGMKPKMREAYDEFGSLACLEVENSILDGTNPGVATIRARQIMGHPETMGLCKGETPAKDDILMGHALDLADYGGGLIAFASLVPEVFRNAKTIAEAGLSVAVMTGDTSDKERNRIDQAYVDGKLDAISATQAVAATGWNWQRTRHMVHTSLSYIDSNLEQSIKRGERELRQEPLRISIFQYENSVDQAIMKVVLAKDELAKSVLTW